MPNKHDLALIIVWLLPLAKAQLILNTYSDNGCSGQYPPLRTVTWTTEPENLVLNDCNEITYSGPSDWTIPSDSDIAATTFSCDETVTSLHWFYDHPSCSSPAGTWRFDPSNAQTLLAGGCAAIEEHAEFAKIWNLTNETKLVCGSATTTTSTNTSTTTNSTTTTNTETTTTTNTTLTHAPPSEWYNPSVEGGNTTTTTTTANSGNTFFYAWENRNYNPGDHFIFQGTPYAPPGDYMFTGVATTLTHPAVVGATHIWVDTFAGFQVGDEILIGNAEMATISGFHSILLNAPLRMSHSAGAQVVVLVASFGAGGGDPVAKFGNVHQEFWLPVDVMHPIIRTPEMNIMASTFAGEGKEQWFGRMIITSAGGFKIAEISVKKDLEKFNKTAVAKNAFETLDVTLGQDDTPMQHMPSPDFYFHRMGVAVTFMRMSDMTKPVSHQFKIQGARRDVVMIACKTAHFIIAASPASEFANWRPELSVRYSHLDIIVTEMHNRQGLKGILPELWGLKPMSNRTKAFLEPIYIDGESESSDVGADQMDSEPTPVSTDNLRFLAERPTAANPSNDVEEDGLLDINGKNDSILLDSCGVTSAQPLPCAT